MGEYRRLRVWEDSHQLTLKVYRLTREFPADERYALTSQLRRAAASIPSNIAEGAGRNSRRDFARFCRISLGSANEVDYHLLLAHELGYICSDDYSQVEADIRAIRRMLSRFIQRLDRPIADSR